MVSKVLQWRVIVIELDDVSIRAGGFELSRVAFAIETGEYIMLMGRTGKGKTTILEAICGLRHVSSGRILVDGVDVTGLLPGDREIGYVPQDHALFPTLTVREHLEFALRIRRRPKLQIRNRVEQLASELGIDHLLQRGVQGLSGGEAQRVALGRALSFDPAVLLLDEPLSALDSDTRADMYELLRTVKKKRVTTLHVTHNIDEAESLADRVLELNDGAVSARSSHTDL